MISKVFFTNSSFQTSSHLQLKSLKIAKTQSSVVKIPSFSVTPNLPRIERQKSQNPLNNTNTNEFSFTWQDNGEKFSSISQKKADKQVQTSFSSRESLSNNGYMRWVICFCDCLINISKYYCMDTPQALQTYFSKGDLHLSSLQYNLFYCIFAFFFILTFFSGNIMEKYGLRFTIFMLCTLCFSGQFFFTLGGSFENYGVMLLGRFFFGIGSFWLDLCQDVLITEWFFDRELALALGMRFTTCRIGSALTIYFTPKVMITGGYFQALLIGLLLSLLGIISSLVMAFVDRNFEKQKGDLENLESFLKDFSYIEKRLSWDSLREMGPVFWLMVFNVMFVYACYLGFVNNSNDILCSLYGYSPQEAGELVTLMYLSACMTPIFGMIIDRVGRRVNIMLVLLLLVSVPFLCFCLTPKEFTKEIILLLLVFIGLFFSSYVATIWSSFPLLVEGKKQYLAFTIVYSTLNISLILASFFVGGLRDLGGDGHEPHEYKGAFVCMVMCLGICFFLVMKVKFSGEKIVHALNSFITNQEIRDIINEDPNLGQRILEMMEIEDDDKKNMTPSFVEMREKNPIL
jgi:MFS family permease